MPKTIWIVYCEGEDWENAEAFLKDKDARDYLSEEMKDEGVSGQIKKIDWEQI